MLLEEHEVPEWLRFPYITKGYRCPKRHNSVRTCMQSLFYIHNEWFNIWSMILSLFSGIMLFTYYVGFAKDRVTGIHITPMCALLVGQVIHHPFSISYHMFMPMSIEIYNKYRRLDLVTILIMNTCLVLGLSWYNYGGVYNSMIATIVAGCFSLYGIKTLFSKLTEQVGAMRNRAVLLIIISATALPYYIAVIMRGFTSGALMSERVGAYMMSFGHSLGALCYVMHFPERYFPRFCILGCAHNIMHVAVFGCYNYGYYYLYDQYLNYSQSPI